MFNKNFYPTPQHVIQQMLFGLELNEATVKELYIASLKMNGHGMNLIVLLVKQKVFILQKNILQIINAKKGI